MYEYRCSSCGKGFSKLARRVLHSDEELPVCPDCGGATARTLSSFAYHRSLRMQLDQLDPQIEREMDAVDTMKHDPLANYRPDFSTANPD